MCGKQEKNNRSDERTEAPFRNPERGHRKPKEERMRLPIYIEGKKYKLSYFKYIAYHSLKRIERLEKKIAQLENELKKPEGKSLEERK